MCLFLQVRLVEEETRQIKRPQRGYVRSVVGIEWEGRREEDEDDDSWQQTVNVTCSASNAIGRQTHTDTRMFNLERVRPADVRGNTIINFSLSNCQDAFHFFFPFFFFLVVHR